MAYFLKLGFPTRSILHANENEGGLLLLPICDGTSRASVNSMAFAFTPIGPRTDSFSAFAFASLEAPQYVYMVFQFCYRIRMPHTGCKES